MWTCNVTNFKIRALIVIYLLINVRNVNSFPDNFLSLCHAGPCIHSLFSLVIIILSLNAHKKTDFRDGFKNFPRKIRTGYGSKQMGKSQQAHPSAPISVGAAIPISSSMLCSKIERICTCSVRATSGRLVMKG